MFLSFSYKPYIVIIGDIINSKELEHRNEVQERLKWTLQDINERYNADIAASFMITLGDCTIFGTAWADEWQLLCLCSGT